MLLSAVSLLFPQAHVLFGDKVTLMSELPSQGRLMSNQI